MDRKPEFLGRCDQHASARGPVHEVLVTNMQQQPAVTLPGKLRMAKAGTRLRSARRTA